MNIEQILHEAYALHQRGELEAAMSRYRAILLADPDEPDANHLLGVALLQGGAAAAAADHLRRAVTEVDDVAEYHFNLGNALRELGDHSGARRAFENAVRLAPDSASAHINLALECQFQDDHGDAASHFSAALEHAPDSDNARLGLADTLRALGQLQAAADAYAAVPLSARQAEGAAHHAECLCNLNQQAAGLDVIDTALRVYTGHPDLLVIQARLREEVGDLAGALAALEAAVPNASADPAALQRLVAAWNNLGNLLERRTRDEEAQTCYRRAMALDPTDAVPVNNLAALLNTRGRPGEAMALLETATRLDPHLAEIYLNMGAAQQQLRQLQAAERCLREALARRPDYAEGLTNLGANLINQQRFDEAFEAYEAAIAQAPGLSVAHSNLLLALNYVCTDAARLQAAQRRFAEYFDRPDGVCAPRDASADRPAVLRIGYLSPDFRSHSVAFFFEAVLRGHDRRRFEVHCYADARRADGVTLRLQGLSDRWTECGGMTDDDLLNRIRDDGIHVLVDLAGHTAGNRLALFGRRAAPLQVSWLGYPASTGLRSMDYRIVDAWTDPPAADAWCSERLQRLPGGFCCYTPPSGAPMPVCTTGRPVTFGSFNNSSKLGPATLDTWARILLGVPGARLLLKSASLGDATVRAHFIAAFEARGVDAQRLDLLGWVPDQSAHLALYADVDIALDPFPYNGTTTTCEALWMGVPVITLAGNLHAGRVGVSLLQRLDLPWLIADDRDAYCQLAAHLAADAALRGRLRRSLRERFAGSGLMDAGAFSADLERAFDSMWQTSAGGR